MGDFAIARCIMGDVRCPDRRFIADSFSCRREKGTHKALDRFRTLSRIVSKNNTKTCWVLKCDIKKFFANIDHEILMNILECNVSDKKILVLLKNIIDSFSSGEPGKGLPLGNLTSQLLVNIYMNEFDQFIRHRLHVKNYIRYADDFVVLSTNRQWLEIILREMEIFLAGRLKLQMHPAKVFIRTLASGVDFLGWIHFPNYRILRAATRRRMLKRIEINTTESVLASYRGLLKHGNTAKISDKISHLFPPAL